MTPHHKYIISYMMTSMTKIFATLALLGAAHGTLGAREVDIRLDRAITAVAVSAPVEVTLVADSERCGHVTYTTPDNDGRESLRIAARPDGTVEVTSTASFERAREIVIYHSGDIRSIHVSAKGEVRADVVKGPGSVSLTADGSGEIEIERLTCGSASISATGTGNVALGYLSADGTVNLTAGGSADADINGGRCGEVNVSASGNCEVDLKGLNSRKAIVSAGGNATIECKSPGEALVADLKSMGSLEVYGSAPSSVTISGKESNLSYK